MNNIVKMQNEMLPLDFMFSSEYHLKNNVIYLINIFPKHTL